VPFCKKCGQEMEQGALFCSNCGNSSTEAVGPYPEITPKGFLASLFDFSMKEIITPKIIRLLFIVSVVILGLYSLIMLAVFATRGGAAIMAVVIIPVLFLLGVIIIRVYLELIVVIFNIYEEIKSVNRNLKNARNT